MFGKTLSEYLRFQRPVLILVAAVGLLRLVLSLAGVPNASVKWLSVTVAAILGAAYYGVKVEQERFGGYRQLLPLVFLQNALVQAIAIVAIALAIFTGRDNIYTAPEYSIEIANPAAHAADGKTWGHAVAHAVIPMVVGTLLWWGIASLALLVTRHTARRRKTGTAAA
jgi:hypothetical protein